MVKGKGTLANNILQGKVEGKTPRGRPAGQWLDDVQEWAGLTLNEMWQNPPTGPCGLEKTYQSCCPQWTELSMAFKKTTFAEILHMTDT